MSIPSFGIPRVDSSTKKPEKELTQYVRHEFRDSNPLWIYSRANGSARTNAVNILKPVPRLLAPVGRIARAVSSLLF